MGEHTYTKSIIVCTFICFLLIASGNSLGSRFAIPQPLFSHETLSFSEQNLIISPPEFYEAAITLAQFHTAEGISTIVVNTTWIYSNYDMAENPPFKGYATNPLSRLFIIDYNDVLAKKIINFLRDNANHSQLEYVTLLGNGQFIPASYYIYSQMRQTKKLLQIIPIPDFYNNRIATDFFYTSPNYDFIPDYKVGRIPVSTVDEADAVVHKIINWQENASWEWFQHVYVAGDQPNHPEEMDLEGCYAGEMIAVDAINHVYFQGMNITKLFWTEGKFNKQSIEDAMKQGDAGFLYVMAHGGVDRWGTYMETDPYVTADDILQFPQNTHVPIVVSVACMCGAFDTYTAHPYTISRGHTSLGESILLSKGAGIAYIGTTRATLGSPLLYLNAGELVITKEREIAGMLTSVFEAYHNGVVRLGDLTKTAIVTYLDENTFSAKPEKDEAFVVLMSFVLLGDPALLLPAQQPETYPSYQQPHLSAQNPDGITSETYQRPWYYTNISFTIQIETNSPQIVVKLIDINTDVVVDRQTLSTVNDSAVYTFTSPNATRYLLRASAVDGREGWLYVTTKNM